MRRNLTYNKVNTIRLIDRALGCYIEPGSCLPPPVVAQTAGTVYRAVTASAASAHDGGWRLKLAGGVGRLCPV